MFDSIGWGEILVLIVAGLFILGPERLPEAAAWLGRSARKVRDFATGARQQLRDEVGTEFDDFREPIDNLRKLRDFDPKRAVSQHLFDDDPDPLGLDEINGTGGDRSSSASGVKSNGHAEGRSGMSARAEPLAPGEKPPVDPDAT